MPTPSSTESDTDANTANTAKSAKSAVERWDGFSRSASTLALAITALLFAQWPLRDVVGGGATQANDLAQALFALYVAVAVWHAGRRHAHLVARPDLAEQHRVAPASASAWRRLGGALCVLPWALCVAAVSAPAVWQSVRQLERFPETSNAGYFVIKLALLLLALLLAWQAAQALWRGWRVPTTPAQDARP